MEQELNKYEKAGALVGGLLGGCSAGAIALPFIACAKICFGNSATANVLAAIGGELIGMAVIEKLGFYDKMEVFIVDEMDPWLVKHGFLKEEEV